MRARRAIVTAAPKGGIGKTFLAKVLFDLLVASGRVVAAWDLDSATGTFAVYDETIKTFDLHGSRDTYSWLDDCYRDNVDDVIIDVPGGRIAETVTAQVVLNAFGGTSARVVIAKNGRFGGVDDFVIFDGIEIAGERRYGATGDLTASVGAETVFIPCLAPRLLAQIDAERLRLIDAAGLAGAERLGRLGSARVQMYLASVEEAIRGSSLAIDGAVPQQKPVR
jgi:hypothetical protein